MYQIIKLVKLVNTGGVKGDGWRVQGFETDILAPMRGIYYEYLYKAKTKDHKLEPPQRANPQRDRRLDNPALERISLS